MNHETPPKILYKYRSIDDFTIRMLREGEIYFATSHELNDNTEYTNFEFSDSAYVILNPYKAAHLGVKYNGNKPVLLSPAQRKQLILLGIKNDREARGIFSLSESCNIRGMFEKYSDNHQGICIGFDWQCFNLTFDGSYPPQRNVPRKVCYRSDLIIRGTADDWLEVLTTKLPLLEHKLEREWRVFYKRGVYQNIQVRKAIREIVFGSKISEDDKEKIICLVADLEKIRFIDLSNKDTSFSGHC